VHRLPADVLVPDTAGCRARLKSRRAHDPSLWPIPSKQDRADSNAVRTEPEKISSERRFRSHRGKKGAQIICYRTFSISIFCQTEEHKNFALAEEVPANRRLFGELSRQLGVVIIASLFEKRGAGVYHNTAAIIDGDGKFLGKYRKMHIPDDPLYHEKFYLPRRSGISGVDTSMAKLASVFVGISGIRKRPVNCIARRTNYLLSHGDRLASEGEKGIW